VYNYFHSPFTEEDLTDSKAHTYPRRRSHTIGSSNTEFHDGKNLNASVPFVIAFPCITFFVKFFHSRNFTVHKKERKKERKK